MPVQEKLVLQPSGISFGSTVQPAPQERWRSLCCEQSRPIASLALACAVHPAHAGGDRAAVTGGPAVPPRVVSDGRVLEILIVLGLVVGATAVVVVPWSSLLAAGVVTTATGLVFGVATGLWYHVALGRALAAASALTPRWWLRPVPLHERLQARALRPVLPWFYAGAAGFVVTLAGIAMIALGMAVALWRAA
jgi:hypothetical protein